MNEWADDVFTYPPLTTHQLVIINSLKDGKRFGLAFILLTDDGSLEIKFIQRG